MRKIALICGLIALIVGCLYWFYQNQEEKFVNPLFYRPLIPISSIARETYLTLNSLKFSNSIVYKKDGEHTEGWTIHQCILQENKTDYIILKCHFYNPVTKQIQYNINKFKISECIGKTYCSNYRWIVELIEYDKNNFRQSGGIYGIE